ncbi:MAG: hypothetical protein RL148_3115 [Planctomycetota bacterium]
MEPRPASSAALPASGVPGVVRMRPEPARLARRGQPWFFADDLQDPVPPETLVRVRDHEGRDLGLGLTSTRSKLALRLCGPWEGDGVPDREAFFARRLGAALERRSHLLGPEDGARLVHGEADALPGLVVDRYASVLVLQVTAAFVEASLDAVVPFLVARLQPKAVVARNDVGTRRFEGLPQEVRLLHGTQVETVDMVEHGIRHAIRPWTGHKTGFYLDQRPARAAVRALAQGRTVLDLFSYQGGFSLAALAGGARSATACDQSEEALACAAAAAQRNGLQGLETVAANVFDHVRALREANRQYGLVVLDPPAFAKSRRELAGGLRGYRDLNRHALRLLEPRGLLVTCTCSHHVDLPSFENVLRQAAAGLPFRVLLRQRLGAGEDHPVWISHPESEYLKVLVLERAD